MPVFEPLLEAPNDTGVRVERLKRRDATVVSSLSIAPVVTPHGRLTMIQADDGPILDPGLAGRLQDAFARGSGHGLLQLGAAEVGTALPPVLSYWRELGTRYVTALCTPPDAEERGVGLAVDPTCEAAYFSTTRESHRPRSCLEHALGESEASRNG